MQAKTLIAALVAGVFAAPVAFAQTGGTGPSGMDQRSADEQTPPKADQEKSTTGRSTAPKAKTSKRSSKRDHERLSRNDRGTTADSGTAADTPNMARGPRTPGNPPKQGSSPEPQ
jgi:Ni/Co efflux regulator RcnB